MGVAVVSTPRKGTAMRKKPANRYPPKTSVRLTPKDWKRLRRLRDEWEMTPSQVIRKALQLAEAVA